MDIPINAQVHCADGVCGKSTYVVVNPTNREVTHVVVEASHFPHTEHLVPTEWIVRSTPRRIDLRCTAKELSTSEPFLRVEFVPGTTPYLSYGSEEFMMWPYALPEELLPALEHENLPAGELAVRRGASVEATDGRVGKIDEFLINPTTGHISHLVLREGHLWGQKDVVIPVSEIDHIEEDVVNLKLDKQSVEALPTIPVRRDLE
jgi:sporulation protein YlmC with PRC-barrel domain